MGIREDAAHVLSSIASYKPDEKQSGRAVDGPLLQQITGLNPERLNNAVDLLGEGAFLKVHHAFMTAPFKFLVVALTSRGRLETERLAERKAQPTPIAPAAPSPGTPPIAAPPTLTPTIYPVGSPYGFTEHDWASVTVDQKDPSRLIVCLGLQWESQFYDTSLVESNVQSMFANALAVNASKTRLLVSLDFRKLKGGYGGHLFNEIARDIIASDVAVFETSDWNANVMIELGVALTWGKTILPIRDKGSPQPPGDIAGQTWAEHRNSCGDWLDAMHATKLAKMVEFALRRKGSI
jgi:hypothetical protein